MLFHKCGYLVVHGKYIFRKCFSVWPCVGCKMIFVFILPSNIIFWKTERESVSEIAPARKERERERERKKREPIAGDPRASTSLATQRLRATNPDRRSTSPFDFDFESHPDRTFWLRRQTQRPGSHAFDFADFAPFNFADFAHLRLRRDGTETISIALRSWLRNGWVLMNLTGSVFIYW